ncbi:Peroxidase [Mycena sanguinolenta]|uniref:Peroxidase n=1 Tax=Mycena sanguinolenta TaxID=230812 RepID=A0A8H6ZI41_9AGAR|nr:Peroxidase [Mycena sanguinolenta]
MVFALPNAALHLTLFIVLLSVAVKAYVWPSPQLDALESLRFELDRHSIASFIQPCTFFLFSVDGPSGRSNVADWIRTAYHDMATYNSTDGTGGMDASIRFAEEQARAENVGDGFNNTFRLLTQITTRYVSIADALALGAIIAIENCGGPEIAFRGGRLDAGEPNAPGVPQPEQDLQSHIDSFARQGFNQTEMIGLVACGHTFGGVQHDPFPDIVPALNDPNNTESVTHFDSTFINFDNNVAKEYISGTTSNPLVVGFNQTTNSDQRIFSSDGNATMRSFAQSSQLFASTCAELFARMLDTVPRGVELTEVITPLPVKPDFLALTLDNDTLQFSGQVRFWNMTEDPNRTAVLLWEDHSGATHNATMSVGDTSTGGGTTSLWYAFDDPGVRLDPVAGITRMSFSIDGELYDQDGVGFAVQDAIAFSKTSCLTNPNSSPIAGRFDIAVRNGANVTRVFLEEEVKDSVGRITVVETDFPRPASPSAATTAYSLWSLNMTQTSSTRTIGAEVDGIKMSTGRLAVLFDLPDC